MKQAEQLRFNLYVRKMVRQLRETLEDPTRHAERPGLIKQLRQYKDRESLTTETKRRVHQVLCDALILDQRHWSEIDTVRGQEIDPYTGEVPEEDMAWEFLRPGDYLKFVHVDGEVHVLRNGVTLIHSYPLEEGGPEDGETIGYRQLQKLVEIVEETEPASEYREVKEVRVNLRTGESVERVYSPQVVARFNTRVSMPRPDVLPLEDRGYLPPTFQPDIELNFDDVQAVAKKYSEEIGRMVQAFVDELDEGIEVEGGRRFCIYRPLQKNGENIVPALSDAEMFYLLKNIARRVTWKIPHADEDRLMDRLIESARLSQFVEEYAEELEIDPIGPRESLSEEEIAEQDDELPLIANAPVIRMKHGDLMNLWLQRRAEFPAPEKIRSNRIGEYTEVYINNPRDWLSIQKLLALVGVTVSEQQAKSMTPKFTLSALTALVNGGGVKQAYRQAWKEYYNPTVREVESQPVIIVGYEGAYLIAERQRTTVRIHSNAIGRFTAAIDGNVANQILAEFPHLRELPVT